MGNVKMDNMRQQTMADVSGNFVVHFNGQRGLFEFKNTKGELLPDSLKVSFTRKNLAEKALQEYTEEEIKKSGKRTSK